jgi:hypothetical protein
MGPMGKGRLAWLFWRVLDAVDYRVTQAKLWAANAVCGPSRRQQLAGGPSARERS